MHLTSRYYHSMLAGTGMCIYGSDSSYSYMQSTMRFLSTCFIDISKQAVLSLQLQVLTGNESSQAYSIAPRNIQGHIPISSASFVVYGYGEENISESSTIQLRIL